MYNALIMLAISANDGIEWTGLKLLAFTLPRLILGARVVGNYQ